MIHSIQEILVIINHDNQLDKKNFDHNWSFNVICDSLCPKLHKQNLSPKLLFCQFSQFMAPNTMQKIRKTNFPIFRKIVSRRKYRKTIAISFNPCQRIKNLYWVPLHNYFLQTIFISHLNQEMSMVMTDFFRLPLRQVFSIFSEFLNLSNNKECLRYISLTIYYKKKSIYS